MSASRSFSASQASRVLVCLGALAGCHGEWTGGASATPTSSPRSDDAALDVVESPPVETTLDHPDIPNAADVWVSMIDAAHGTIDFAEFYASEAEAKDLSTSKLTPVIAAIERAVARRVHVRFLADSVFAPKYPETLEHFRKIGVEVRVITFSSLGGGVLHAKYFVVDGIDVFVGSQNFDWRALSHIQEMGVHVRSAVIGGTLLDIFDTDWALTGGADHATRVHRHSSTLAFHDVRARTGEHITLGASPKGWLPDEDSWELPKILAMLDGATRSVDVQVLTYKTKERDGTPFVTLDEALRRAAARGVRVRLLVSDWAGKPGSDGRTVLEELTRVPNVEVHVITIPPFSGGEIPFGRVAHAKYMVVDGATPAPRAWVGTSNWEGDYFTKSRNVSILVEGGAAPVKLEHAFEDGWGGAYAKPLTPSASAPAAASAPPSSSGSPRP